MPDFDVVGLVRTAGYIGVFAIIFAETGLLVGFFLPGDSLLFTAGFLASQGILEIWVLVPLCFIAAVAGDTVGYAIGLRFGRNLFNRPESLLFKRENLLRAESFFHRHGGKTVVLARFVPFIRTFAPVVAGVGAMRYRAFALYNLAGGLLWAACMTLSGYFLGSRIPQRQFDRLLIPIVLALALLSVLPTVIHLGRQGSGQLKALVRRQLRR